ncbi:alpha-N-acetylglucosaminidase [Rhodanobacter sp. 7MK24]|uniref:alpha-N-acetylglucosaminidase n=1 Tax=Rhodanobacter sp. 7MK24 TaxID=2775922 RepID=UPI0017819569|nr:alpha-N-acetylglucosaminidase [Rhodanobacter sp. 7MK24]MBD8880342.1 alpha-N-acetylglucosaminidase [Rhodanobacter sp. 7MK24]
MKRALQRWLVCLLLVGTGMPVAFAGEPAKPAFDIAPARAALLRLLPKQQAQFALVALDRGQGADRFEVRGTPGHIVVAGTSPAVILTGVETYLQQAAHVDIGWPGDSLARLPATLPAPASPIEHRAVVPDRYALNDTDDGYSNAYLAWPAWEHKIDLLALHGIDEVFMPIGTEEVYRRTFQDFGYSDAAMRAWIPATAHQPWWLLQNMSGFDAPLSPQQYARRVALAQKIVARLRELGITPVFPGWFGTVPPDFVAKHPGANVVPQGRWVGFTRPDWLDPRDPLYAKVAADFYRQQRALFGDSSMYKMDLLHEGGRAGNVPVADAARGVMAALQAAHPGARWVMLGWQHNPLPAVIDAVDRQRLLIVDGLSDRYDGLDREKDWHGAPYAFGSIPNFGGHTTLGANADVWFRRFAAWQSKPGSKLRGIAWMPEASGIDPAAFALFTALAWSHPPSDGSEWYEESSWFKMYADSRYGGADAHAEAAWRILAETAYAMPSDGDSEPQDSLFEARPSQDVSTAASWSPRAMRYDAGHFAQAICELLQVAPALRDTSAYHHDVVDVARQTLANRARVLLPQIEAAYAAKDAARLHALDTEWLGDMALLDRLLASDPDFLLGNWLAPARAEAGNEAEAAQFVYDQRAIITVWGEREGADMGGLHDYANRELSGLVSGLYEPRWRRFFASLEQSLATGKPPEKIDWYAMEHAWAVSHEEEPATPQGDPWQLATEVTQRLGLCKP